MRKKHLIAGLLMAAALPSMAFAQESCEQRSQNRTTGTVVGAVGGALVGGAVSNTRSKGTGALVGGILGAIVGNQLAKGPADCQHAYGWYDNGGSWHANGVDPSAATGYYDRQGQWVYGRPVDYAPPPPAYAPAPRPAYAPAPPPAYGRRDRDERFDDDDFRGQGYPEFRDREEHIRFMIRDGLRDDLIERDDARDLMEQLRDIRRDEAREYQVHGARLPRDDYDRISDRLARLDRLVDQIRDER